MWPGDDLDSMLMDAAQALDLGRVRCATSHYDCTVLLAALKLAQEPDGDLPWVPEYLVRDRLALDDYASQYGMLHD